MTSRRYLGRGVVIAAAVLGLFTFGAEAASTKNVYVNQANTHCSDTGTGSSTTPYCTISAAATKVTSGTTVQVYSGTYNGQVTPKNSGTSSAPIVYTVVNGATVTVTGGKYGFYLNALSYVTVNGFTVTGTPNQGIDVLNSSNITISNNHVSYSGLPQQNLTQSGIYIFTTSNSLISGNTTDHNTDAGIQLTTGSTGDEVRGNTSFANAQQWQRQATGIRLYKSSGNTIDRNIVHDNEDSGIESFNTSNNNLIYDNVSYRNGDHGIDDNACTGQRIISNTVYSNSTAGINLENSSTGGTIENNIAVDNGIGSTRTRSDIRVEQGSTSGTTADWNLVWLSTPDTLLIWNSINYTSLSSFQTATGQMLNGTFGDPKWANPANGDFHLTAGSPAIDSANSGISGEPGTDIAGNSRIDDAATPNTGIGPRTYDDRGAYEFQPPDYAPVPKLTLTPSSGSAPLTVKADASGSTDIDKTPIKSYTFDFGDGAKIGPQSGATASHTYSVAGTYTVTVTVTDTANLSASTTQSVTVKDSPPTAALTVTPNSGTAPLQVTADATASTDNDSTPIASYTFNFGDGTIVGPQAGATANHTFTSPGGYTVTVTVTDTAGLSSQTSSFISVSTGNDQPPAATLLVTPSTGTMPLQVTTDASNSTDSDASPIASFSFDFGDATTTGPQATATATHTYSAAGTYTVTVTVTDTAGLSSTATAGVIVEDAPPAAALAVTPSSGSAPLSVTADASASTDTDATPVASYTFDFGDGTVVGPQGGATATHTYTSAGTFAVTTTVTDTAGNSSQATQQVSVGAGLVTNGGFETGLTGWNTSGSGSGVTLTRVSGGHTGNYAALLTNTSTTNSSCLLNDAPNWVATTRNGTYTGSLWVRADTAGATLNLRVREFVGSSNVGTATSTITLSTSWQQLTVSYTPKSPGSSNLDFNAYLTTASSPPGTCFYADDAAIGFASPDAPPAAALTVSPNSGAPPLQVTADATGSTDTDATPIATYSFDFGDGTVVGPQSTATANHTYSTAGTYNVTVTETDTGGLTSTATSQVNVGSSSGGTNLVGNPGFETDTSGWDIAGSGQGVALTRVSGGHSGNWSAQLANTSTLNANCVLDDGSNWVGTTGGGTYTGSLWVRADTTGANLTLRFREYSGTRLLHTWQAAVKLTASWQQVTVAAAPTSPGSTFDFNALVANAHPGTCFYADDASIVHTSTDAPPAAAVSVSPATGVAPLQVTADASASTDTDSWPISSYSFDFGDGTVIGPQAGTTATHTYSTPGTYTVTVTVTDTAGLSNTASAQVTVNQFDAPPSAALSVTPTSGVAPLQVTADASASTDTDATPIASYSFDFGDGTVTGAQTGSTATHTYSAAGTYTVTVTVTDTGGQSSTATGQVVVSTTGPQNLVGNPGFETGLTGWNTSGSGTGVTITQVSGGHSGNYAALLTNTSTSTSGCTLNDGPNWVAKTSAGTYTASLWVRADTAGKALNLRLREYNGSTLVGSALATLTLSTDWQQVAVSYTTQSPGSTLDFNTYLSTANSPPGTCFYADDASITLG